LYFVVTLVPIVITYLASEFKFPDLDKIKDLKIYFDKNYKIITFLTALFMISTMGIQVWEDHIEMLSQFVIFRIINDGFMGVVAVFDFKKLRCAMSGLIAIGLSIASFSLAFI